MSDQRRHERPEFVSEQELRDAAEAFIAAIGWRNAQYLSTNLRFTTRDSDALRALDYALVRTFNVVRQEQIREENASRA